MGNKFLIPAIALLFLLALSLKAYAGLVYVRKITLRAQEPLKEICNLT